MPRPADAILTTGKIAAPTWAVPGLTSRDIVAALKCRTLRYASDL